MDVSMYEPYTSYACCDDSNVFFSTSILPCHHMVMKWSWYLGCYHPLLSFRIYVSSIHLYFFSHCFCYSPTSPFAPSKRFCHRSLFSSLLECLDCLGWLWLHFLLVFVSHKAANSALAGLLVPFATDTRCRIWSVTKKSRYCIASKCHCIARKEERESLEVQWKPKSSKHRDGRTSISSAGSSTYLFKSMRAQNENTIRVVFDEVSSFHPWLHASTQWKGVELRADTLPDFGTSRVSKRCHCFSLFACGLWCKHFSSWLRTRLVHCWWYHRCHRSFPIFIASLRYVQPRHDRQETKCCAFLSGSVSKFDLCSILKDLDLNLGQSHPSLAALFGFSDLSNAPSQLFHSPSAGAISAGV